MRLAFAVAAHLEPEILIIDEVLAVGDAEFQKTCLGKMSDVAHERTMLFVSYNLQSILRLCSKVLLLYHGNLLMQGDPKEVTVYYLKFNQLYEGSVNWSEENPPGNDEVKLISVNLTDSFGENKSIIDLNEPLLLKIEYLVKKQD